MTRAQMVAEATWTVRVCPECAAQSPEHRGVCLDDPPGLRPLHMPQRVVAEEWRLIASNQKQGGS